VIIYHNGFKNASTFFNFFLFLFLKRRESLATQADT